MRQAVVRRKLAETQDRLVQTRHELAVLTEQYAALDEAAEELRLRNLVSETPLSAAEYGDVRRAADVLDRARQALEDATRELEAARAGLLERMEVEP